MDYLNRCADTTMPISAHQIVMIVVSDYLSTKFTKEKCIDQKVGRNAIQFTEKIGKKENNKYIMTEELNRNSYPRRGIPLYSFIFCPAKTSFLRNILDFPSSTPLFPPYSINDTLLSSVDNLFKFPYHLPTHSSSFTLCPHLPFYPSVIPFFLSALSFSCFASQSYLSLSSLHSSLSSFHFLPALLPLAEVFFPFPAEVFRPFGLEVAFFS